MEGIGHNVRNADSRQGERTAAMRMGIKPSSRRPHCAQPSGLTLSEICPRKVRGVRLAQAAELVAAEIGEAELLGIELRVVFDREQNPKVPPSKGPRRA
eukprot:3202025-Alexandrium_andersonii.AAC.1